MDPTDTYSVEQVHDLAGGTLVVLDIDHTFDASRLVYEALTCLPKHVARRVIDECYFVMPRSDVPGMVLPREITKCKVIIGLAESLLSLPKTESLEVVLHEIAHHFLWHGNAVFDDLSPEEAEQQEREATEQAEAWLENYPCGGAAEMGGVL